MRDLEIVLAAARKWADELTEYIAPDAEQRGADQEVDDYQAQADAITAAVLALEAERGRNPDPSPVSYSPCLTGKVEIDGANSEFMIPFENDSVKYSQWGADNTILWPRADLMEALADAAREWWLDNNDTEEDPDA